MLDVLLGDPCEELTSFGDACSHVLCVSQNAFGRMFVVWDSRDGFGETPAVVEPYNDTNEKCQNSDWRGTKERKNGRFHVDTVDGK